MMSMEKDWVDPTFSKKDSKCLDYNLNIAIAIGITPFCILNISRKKEMLSMHSRRELLNLWLFSMGKTVSELGTQVYTFAIGLYVLKLTGSGLNFATTLFLGVLPVILINPIAGVIVDRLDKKKIIILMDVLNGSLFVGLFLLTTHKEISLALIFISIFTSNVFNTIFGLGMETGKPYIVSDEQLLKLNSIGKILDSIPSILGPVIGGIVFAFIDIRSFIFVNGVSFLMSAFTECFIDFNFNKQETATQDVVKTTSQGSSQDFKQSLKEGFVYIKTQKDVIRLFEIFIILNFFLSFSVSVPLPYIINSVLKLTPKAFGMIEGAFPCGIILGTLIINKVHQHIDYYPFLLKISRYLSLSVILLSIPLFFHLSDLFYITYYLVFMLFFGIAIAMIDIPIVYFLQRSIPDYIRGRVMSLGFGAVKVIAPMGLLLSGLLLNSMNVSAITMVGGVAFFVFIQRRF